jgi:hypothetical protein
MVTEVLHRPPRVFGEIMGEASLQEIISLYGEDMADIVPVG